MYYSKGLTGLPLECFYSRVEAIRKEIALEKLDGYLILNDEFRSSHSLSITDYTPLMCVEFSPQILFITASSVSVFLGSINMDRAKEQSWVEDIRHLDTIEDFFKDYYGKRIGICGLDSLIGLYRKIIDKLGENINFLPKDYILDNLLMYKSTEEIDRILIANKTADKTIEYMIKNTENGSSTEADIAAEGEYFIAKEGMSLGYDTIVAVGENTTDRTHRPKRVIVNNNEPIILNIVPRYKGYCAFTTTTYPNGNAEAENICHKAKEVIRHMVTNLNIGDSSQKIYQLYIDKSKELGLLENFLVGGNRHNFIGHSTGLNVVQKPLLEKHTNIILEKGMVLSLKYFLTGFEFGDIRFEFSIYIGDEIILLNNL